MLQLLCGDGLPPMLISYPRRTRPSQRLELRGGHDGIYSTIKHINYDDRA